jgi:hypothetical protein
MMMCVMIVVMMIIFIMMMIILTMKKWKWWGVMTLNINNNYNVYNDYDYSGNDTTYLMVFGGSSVTAGAYKRNHLTSLS